MGVPFVVKLKGLEGVLGLFNGFAKNWESEQLKATEEAGDYVLEKLPNYPGAPASSRYHRTGTLGKSLNRKARRTRDGVVGIIGSPVVYSPWVISDTKQSGAGPQTWFHQQHGWFTLHKEIKKLKKGIVGVYKSALKRAKRRS